MENERAQALFDYLNARELETLDREREALIQEHEVGGEAIKRLSELSGWPQERCLRVIGQLAAIYTDLSWARLAYLATSMFETNKQLDEAAEKGERR